MSYLATSPKQFIEDASNEVVLRKDELGVDPLTTHQRHHFQFVTLAGGTASIDIFGPAGTWQEISSGWAEGDVAIIDEPHRAFRVRFVGTGGAGEVWVQSFPRGW